MTVIAETVRKRPVQSSDSTGKRLVRRDLVWGTREAVRLLNRPDTPIRVPTKLGARSRELLQAPTKLNPVYRYEIEI